MKFRPSASAGIASQLRRWRTPLEADKKSKELLLSILPSESRGQDYIGATGDFRTFPHPLRDVCGKAYVVSLKMPKGLYTPSGVQEFVDIIEYLNCIARRPVTTFIWDRAGGGQHNVIGDTVSMGVRSAIKDISLFDSTKSILVHEMGHVIHSRVILWKTFHGDRDWTLIHEVALGWQNYEMVDDSNYMPEADDLGHPFDDESETFASSLHAYLLFADKFIEYLRHPQTPDAMRQFGKAVWCYLRERIFGGRVFTSDGKDPLAQERLDKLLKALEPKRLAALTSGLRDEEPNVRKEAAYAALRRGPKAKALIPELRRCLKDPIGDVRKAAEKALLYISPKS